MSKDTYYHISFSIHISSPGWEHTESQTTSISAPSLNAAKVAVSSGVGDLAHRMAADVLEAVQVLAAQAERDRASNGPEWAEGLGDDEEDTKTCDGCGRVVTPLSRVNIRMICDTCYWSQEMVNQEDEGDDD